MKQLILTENADMRTALQDKMMRERLDEEAMDEEEVETLMLSIEYWTEKSTSVGTHTASLTATPGPTETAGSRWRGKMRRERRRVMMKDTRE